MVTRKKKSLAKLTVAGLEAKYLGSGIAEDILPDWSEEFFVPTNSPVVNYLLGGGFLYGRIVEIAGFEASGKTLLALDAIAAAQELGGVGIFIDAEMAFSKWWAEENKIDVNDLYLFEENVLEVISDFVAESAIAYRSELTENEPIVLVVDSIAALDTWEAMSSSEMTAKAEMGIRAKALYKMLRIRNKLWKKLGITVLFINQLRDAIDTSFGAKFKDQRATPGGKAMRFFTSQRVYLESKKSLTTGNKERKKKVGIEVAFEMKKNKIAPPKYTQRITVIFDPSYDEVGFSKYEGLAEIVIKAEGVDKAGNTYSLNGEVIATSRIGLQNALEQDDDLREDVLFEAKIMTIAEMQVRLDEELDNRYPVENITFKPTKEEKDEEADG